MTQDSGSGETEMKLTADSGQARAVAGPASSTPPREVSQQIRNVCELKTELLVLLALQSPKDIPRGPF